MLWLYCCPSPPPPPPAHPPPSPCLTRCWKASPSPPPPTILVLPPALPPLPGKPDDRKLVSFCLCTSASRLSKGSGEKSKRSSKLTVPKSMAPRGLGCRLGATALYKSGAVSRCVAAGGQEYTDTRRPANPPTSVSILESFFLLLVTSPPPRHLGSKMIVTAAIYLKIWHPRFRKIGREGV